MEEDYADPLELISDEETDEEEVFVQKTFHFKAEMAGLINYDVISNLVWLIKQADTLDTNVVKGVAYFFNRVVKQNRAEFVFYQLSTMEGFESFLLQNRKNP